MLLGILSDSHGHAEITRKALHQLKQRGAQMYVHLGDVCSESVLEELIGFNCRVVFGNCDDAASLGRYAAILQLTVDHPMGLIEIGGKKIAFTHGHLPNLMAEALRQNVDYLLHGHTHELRDERAGGTRVINPGALFRASRYTAALLDPGKDHLEIVAVARPA